MTHESSGYMTQLDEWTDKQVLYPYDEAWLGLDEASPTKRPRMGAKST